MQRGSFLKTGVFQVAEYVIWNHEVVSSSLASCTKVCWCNGNITDCLSVVMSSILIQTAACWL